MDDREPMINRMQQIAKTSIEWYCEKNGLDPNNLEASINKKEEEEHARVARIFQK